MNSDKTDNAGETYEVDSYDMKQLMATNLCLKLNDIKEGIENSLMKIDADDCVANEYCEDAAEYVFDAMEMLKDMQKHMFDKRNINK